MEQLLSAWQKKTSKLLELNEWLGKAEAELRKAPKSDPRWEAYNEVKAAMERLEEQIERIEQDQEAALAGVLEEAGPLTIRQEDGTCRVVAASDRTAGGAKALLPSDLLRVWRVAEVFGGSVVLDGERAELRFGWREQLEALKAKPKEKKAKKGAVIGEEASLFGRE